MRHAYEASFVDLDLTRLGWARAARTAPADLLAAHPTTSPARVVRVDRGRLLLVGSGDGRLVHVRDQTLGRGDECPTVVGDWVLVEAPSLEAGGHGFARARLPRTGVLARRRDTSSTQPQVLAANLDLVLVAEALDPSRVVNEARVARFVALAAADGLDVHVVLTNADRVDAAAIPGTVAGVDATATSVIDGTGLDALRDLLVPGSTATIVGASGAGKSSLVNALVSQEPMLAVGERRSSGTGRHTTSVSRMVPLAHGALLVDTPGIRLIGMHAGVDASVLAPNSIGELAERCRFRDCHHDGEPGCAVEAAIDAGELPGDAIATWRKLEREALRERARVDDRLRRELAGANLSRARQFAKARRRGEHPERR